MTDTNVPTRCISALNPEVEKIILLKTGQHPSHAGRPTGLNLAMELQRAALDTVGVRLLGMTLKPLRNRSSALQRYHAVSGPVFRARLSIHCRMRWILPNPSVIPSLFDLLTPLAEWGVLL